MAFNMTRNLNFPPEIFLGNNEFLEEVESFNILGVIVSNKLTWDANTEYIVGKANKRIWSIRRLKNLGLDNDFILDVYNKEIRSVLEFAAPVWNGAEQSCTDILKGFSKYCYKMDIQIMKMLAIHSTMKHLRIGERKFV